MDEDAYPNRTGVEVNKQRLGLLICIAFAVTAGEYVGFKIGRDAERYEHPKAALVAPSNVHLGVWFSPLGGCTAEVVKEIDAAKVSLHCQAYSFTSQPIADALLRAKQRGVKIVLILDKSDLTVKGSDLSFFDTNETWIDPKHAIAHNKIMLIDGKVIITGSFNFTTAAEHSNAENLLVIRDDSQLYAEYEANLQKHLEHSYRH